jgi:hypothetical protein
MNLFNHAASNTGEDSLDYLRLRMGRIPSPYERDTEAAEELALSQAELGRLAAWRPVDSHGEGDDVIAVVFSTRETLAFNAAIGTGLVRIESGLNWTFKPEMLITYPTGSRA